ncbi:hypothetical protein AB4Z25_24825 [Rhizobium sp. RAF36]
MKNLTKEQLELLAMLADTNKLRHMPNATACLVTLEELGLVGPDFQATEAGRRILESQSRIDYAASSTENCPTG